MTGGGGFIGSNLVHALVDAGATVRVIDDFSTGRRENLQDLEGRIELLDASITDPDACVAACEGMDYVLHQAAIPSVPRSVKNPLRTHAACATGTLNMLEAARAEGVRRFVCASSSSAYGDTVELPKHENLPSKPLSPYAVAKLAGESYTRVYNRVYGLETVSLRYFNVFGPRQDPNSPYSAVIPLFITMALEGRAPTIHGDGEQTRDFTYIDNVMAANLLACTAPAEKCAGNVYNVGCGDRISINRLWEEIREMTGCEAEAKYSPRRDGDVKDSLASLDRIRDALGFEPTIDLAEGLRRTMEWLQDNP